LQEAGEKRIPKVFEKEEARGTVFGQDPGRRKADGREVARDHSESGGIVPLAGWGIHEHGGFAVQHETVVTAIGGIAGEKAALGAGPSRAGKEGLRKGVAICHLG
jgi:hypothetical protein